MKRIATIALTTIASLTAVAASAGSLNGTKWQSVDDKTGEKKAVVQFTERNGVLSGKIIRVNDRSKANKVCSKCPGSLKGQKVEGLRIISGLKAKGTNAWGDGKLVDPETGKTYSGKVTLSSNGQTLKLRGYVGISALGRSQTWKRIN